MFYAYQRTVINTPFKKRYAVIKYDSLSEPSKAQLESHINPTSWTPDLTFSVVLKKFDMGGYF